MGKKKLRNLLEKETMMANVTGIHGTKYLRDKSGMRFYFWALVLVIDAVTSITFILWVKHKYDNNTFLTKIDATCRVSEVPFPAVAICNFNAVSYRRSRNIYHILKNHNRTDNEINSFLSELPILRNFGNSETEVGFHKEILKILKGHHFNIESIMKEIHQPCEALLLHCSFNNILKNCTDIFRMIKTYFGFCCAFNYVAYVDIHRKEKPPLDERLEYFNDPDSYEDVDDVILSTSRSGRRSGLSVVMNLESSDYPPWSLEPYYGGKVLIFDPSDYPETTLEYEILEVNEVLDVKINPKVYKIEPQIRQVPLEKRKCWLKSDKIKTRIENTYNHKDNYEICRSRCKLEKFQNACGCAPFQYEKDDNFTRFCEFSDIKCLHEVRATAGRWLCNRTCFVDCLEFGYRLTTDSQPLNTLLLPINYKVSSNLSELSVLRVYYGKSTCNCYTLSLVINFENFVGTYGGILSISFGASVITIFEIIYLSCVYLYKCIRNRIKMKNIVSCKR